jgi:uncharacterized protein (TIGR00369 family)
MMEGRHPHAPYSDTMDIDLIEVDTGRVIMIGRPSQRFLNPMGYVQGGWAAAILDAAMAHAVHTMLAAGNNYTTLEMKLNYVRPVLPGSVVRCEGKVVHMGRRTATSEGRLFDEHGKLLAHASETCIILPAEAP